MSQEEYFSKIDEERAFLCPHLKRMDEERLAHYTKGKHWRIAHVALNYATNI